MCHEKTTELQASKSDIHTLKSLESTRKKGVDKLPYKCESSFFVALWRRLKVYDKEDAFDIIYLTFQKASKSPSPKRKY